MKKILLAIILLGAAVGGYFVVNLDWQSILQQKKPLTEQEVRSLLKEKLGGTINTLEFHNSNTPYYTAEVVVKEEIITLEVDAISKRISLKQNQTTNDDQETANEEASDHDQDQTAQPQLPLTKEGAVQVAQEQFDGDVTDIILVDKNNVTSYQVTLQSNTEMALLEFDQQSGELIQNEVTALQNGNPIDSVASALNQNSKNSKATQQQTTKPNINNIETPSIATVSLDEAKEIALKKVDGYIRSAKLNDQNLYEIKITKGKAIHTLKIHPSTGLITESTTE